MKIQVADWTPYGSTIRVAMVPAEYTEGGANAAAGDALIEQIWKYFPTNGIMLVSAAQGGLRAYAPFQTETLVSLLEHEDLHYAELDLSIPPAVIEDELPF